MLSIVPVLISEGEFAEFAKLAAKVGKVGKGKQADWHKFLHLSTITVIVTERATSAMRPHSQWRATAEYGLGQIRSRVQHASPGHS